MRNCLLAVALVIVSVRCLALSPAESNRLYEAVVNNSIDSIRSFLDAGGSPDVTVHQVDTSKSDLAHWSGTMLQLAIQAGHDAIVAMLLEAGADVEKVELYGSPLQLATDQGMSMLVLQLINKDPLLLTQGPPDSSPLIVASLGGWYDLVATMLEVGRQAGIDWDSRLDLALRQALTGGNEDVARLLLNAGASATDVLAFHAAVAHSNVRMVKELIDAGASPTARFEGKNALDGVVFRAERDPSSRQPAIITGALVDAGVDVCGYLGEVENMDDRIEEMFRREVTCK